jgi:hypothetical protein
MRMFGRVRVPTVVKCKVTLIYNYVRLRLTKPRKRQAPDLHFALVGPGPAGLQPAPGASLEATEPPEVRRLCEAWSGGYGFRSG